MQIFEHRAIKSMKHYTLIFMAIRSMKLNGNTETEKNKHYTYTRLINYVGVIFYFHVGNIYMVIQLTSISIKSLLIIP